MANYIDGYVFPIATEHLNEYKSIAEKVAKIWKEHGALAYFEYVSDGLTIAGTRSFTDCLNLKENETPIFGWIVFASKESRNAAHKKVAADSRMADLVAPLVQADRMIFDAGKMVFGGFEGFV